MRRLLALVLVLAACGGGSAVPTPDEILDDGIVTDEEFRSALGAVEECVDEAGAEFSVAFDQNGVPRYRASGGDKLDAIVNACITIHLGPVEAAWDEQHGPTPEEDAAFFDGVVSCVEAGLGVELGTVQPSASGRGPETAVTDAAIAADPDLYASCFEQQLSDGGEG
jgi:hypothetical protein